MLTLVNIFIINEDEIRLYFLNFSQGLREGT